MLTFLPMLVLGGPQLRIGGCVIEESASGALSSTCDIDGLSLEQRIAQLEAENVALRQRVTDIEGGVAIVGAGVLPNPPPAPLLPPSPPAPPALPNAPLTWYSTYADSYASSGTSSWKPAGDDRTAGNHYSVAVIDHIFDGDFDIVVKVDQQTWFGGGMVYGQIPAGTSLHQDVDVSGCSSGGRYAQSVCDGIYCSGGTICSLGLSYTGGWSWFDTSSAAAVAYARFARSGNTLFQYAYFGTPMPQAALADLPTGAAAGSSSGWSSVSSSTLSLRPVQVTIDPSDRVFIAMGEAGSSFGASSPVNGWFDAMYYDEAVAQGWPTTAAEYPQPAGR